MGDPVAERSPGILIQEAVRRLVTAAHPVQIILFGSRARGDSTGDSDFDFLVIMPGPVDKYSEMVRLSRVLASLRVPADVLVYSVKEVEEQRHLPGHALRAALSEGKVLYDVAS